MTLNVPVKITITPGKEDPGKGVVNVEWKEPEDEPLHKARRGRTAAEEMGMSHAYDDIPWVRYSDQEKDHQSETGTVYQTHLEYASAEEMNVKDIFSEILGDIQSYRKNAAPKR